MSADDDVIRPLGDRIHSNRFFQHLEKRDVCFHTDKYNYLYNLKKNEQKNIEK